jgi:hypothetical protein
MKSPADETGMVEQETDSRITYPCYKSFDEFIDVERLKSLDRFLTEKVAEHLGAEKHGNFMNSHRLKSSTPETPGQRVIYLTDSVRPFSYYDLDKPELWERTAKAGEFAPLMDFIETLPFKATARMMIICDDAPRAVPAHRDHLSADICHDFIWFRTNLQKPFYVLNHKTDEKLYVESYSAWFDTVNQFHGSDPREGISFSIRVDGQFTQELKNQIPQPAFNAASAPALWACASG